MSNDSSKYIATRLKKLRLEQHLTQETLAKKAGINANFYARIERDERGLSLAKFEKIVKALGVKSSNILPF
jgi:transcriptional regulator with XRE-family HTH domain